MPHRTPKHGAMFENEHVRVTFDETTAYHRLHPLDDGYYLSAVCKTSCAMMMLESVLHVAIEPNVSVVQIRWDGRSRFGYNALTQLCGADPRTLLLQASAAMA
ncbi:MAG: hypothetical protein WAX89_05460 [Alphaproteobacteria bacterium]